MNTFEIIELLAQKPKEEIKYSLLILMLKGKIDFIDINAAYVDCLERQNEDKLNQLIESETCVLESFHCKKSNKKDYDMKHTQRCLYLLNQSKRFQMQTLNEKYEYNEEKAKEYSWYEQNKKRRI